MTTNWIFQTYDINFFKSIERVIWSQLSCDLTTVFHSRDLWSALLMRRLVNKHATLFKRYALDDSEDVYSDLHSIIHHDRHIHP